MLLTLVLAWSLLVNITEADPILDMGEVPPKSTAVPPTVLILDPQNNTTTSTSNIWLALKITPARDPIARRRCNLVEVYYSASWQPNKVTVFNDDAGGYVVDVWQNEIELKKIPQGVNSVTVTAVYYGEYYPYKYPYAEAYFTISGSSTVTFAVDLTPLHIGILAPYPQAYSTSDVALTLTTNEKTSQLQYSLDAQDNITINGNATLSGLTAGSHNVTVYGWDQFGNPGNSETTTFTITEPEQLPTSQLIAASAVASATAICLALIVYFTKRKKKKTTQ